ncbi:MAG: hypothetical protein ACAI18_19640 [Gemmatimonadales bacterium]
MTARLAAIPALLFGLLLAGGAEAQVQVPGEALIDYDGIAELYGVRGPILELMAGTGRSPRLSRRWRGEPGSRWRTCTAHQRGPFEPKISPVMIWVLQATVRSGPAGLN